MVPVELRQRLVDVDEDVVPVLGRACDVVHPVGQQLPDVIPEVVAAELLHRGLHPLSEVVVSLLGPGDSDDAELLGQKLPVRE